MADLAEARVGPADRGVGQGADRVGLAPVDLDQVARRQGRDRKTFPSKSQNKSFAQ
jgi:hypothetical protein